MVMPRPRLMSMVSSNCAFISRAATVPGVGALGCTRQADRPSTMRGTVAVLLRALAIIARRVQR